MDNNPILKNNPLGDTVFVNKFGSVIKNTGTDKLVYQETKKGNKFIGELGGKVKTKEITKNLLAVNKEIAKAFKALSGVGTTTAVWANTVKPFAPWDYKKNTETIFGVAWAFDDAQREKTGSDNRTMFTISTEKNGKTTEMNAADFGNFNAGYTGTYAGVDKSLQLIGAGGAEMFKHNDWLGMIKQSLSPSFPFGDQMKDAIFNLYGMKVADNEK